MENPEAEALKLIDYLIETLKEVQPVLPLFKQALEENEELRKKLIDLKDKYEKVKDGWFSEAKEWDRQKAQLQSELQTYKKIVEGLPSEEEMKDIIKSVDFDKDKDFVRGIKKGWLSLSGIIKLAKALLARIRGGK